MKDKEILQMIADERVRKSAKYGYTNEAILERTEDYGNDELALAAACFAIPANRRDMKYEHIGVYDIKVSNVPELFPWDGSYWKPTPDNRIKELVKAAAFIVDEIYRLQSFTQPKP